MGYVRDVNIYVYQINDHAYGAGFVRRVCESRGTIVETWPCNTEDQIRYVKRNSSKFEGVYDRVKQLAEQAEGYLSSERFEFDEEREAVLLELAALPFIVRFKAGIKVIFGLYQEK